MKEILVTETEYNKLIQRLDFYDSTRNNLLTFSFTSVLTVLGVALAMKLDEISSWICLIPFLLIIPFSARIAYYRLATAHITSFLKNFCKEKMQFEIGTKVVKENQIILFNVIAWLVNHEMVLLSIATSCIFYFKYTLCISNWDFFHVVVLFIPIILSTLVYCITDSVYNYDKLIDKFNKKWDDYNNFDDE